jgi:hypothetical protein
MDQTTELQQAGFSDEEIGRYMGQRGTELKDAGFSDYEIGNYFGSTKIYEAKQENNSLLQRARNYLGISGEEGKPTELGKIVKPAIAEMTKLIPITQFVFGTQTEHDVQDMSFFAEVDRVVNQGVAGLTGGLNELLFGKAQRPKTLPGTITGSGAELGGFLAGPFSAAKFLTGTRLAPTATGLMRTAQILAQGGAQLGIASGLSRILPGIMDDPDFGNYGLDILKNTALGTLTGIVYPIMGIFPTKPLRMAMTLAVMDTIRATTGGMGFSTIDDFIDGVNKGTMDKKEIGKLAFGYLMDLYFSSKTPSMRVQLKGMAANNEMINEIKNLDPDKVAQTILDVANADSYDAKVKELGLNRAVQYEGQTYEAKPGEIHAQVVERNGLPFDEKVVDGYTDKNGDFLTRDKVVSAVREGEGIQSSRLSESLGGTVGAEKIRQSKIIREIAYQDMMIHEKLPEEVVPIVGRKLSEIKGNEIPLPTSGEQNKPIEPLLEMTLRYSPEKEMVQAATEAMVEKGIARDPNRMMSEQLADEWLSDKPRYEPITAKYGTTVEKWAAEMFVMEASSWGRKLGAVGLATQRLENIHPEFAKAMKELADINKVPSLWDAILHGWKSFDQIRRGLLVTQLSTSIRNFETQIGRVGLDIPEKAMNSALQRLFGKDVSVHPMDGVEQMVDVFRRDNSKKITELVLKQFPKEYDRMYGSYMADIETGQLGSAIGRGVDILNTVNRFQEFLVRNGVFKASLEQKLRSEGKNLIEIIEKNQVGTISQEAIEYSVSRAMEMTFAQTPRGQVGSSLVKFVNNFPGASFIMPFPRFFVNSTKFVVEYNPTGFLKLLSKTERTAIANGDMHVLSRATLGTIMLGLAYLFRDSEYAGEKWYDIRAGDKTIDTRPYNPFAAYLFIADVTHKAIHGNLERLTSKDIALGVLSSNLRAGMGLYAMDQIINAVSKTGDPQKATDYIKQALGEVAGGLLTPFNQVKEFLSGFSDYIVREKRSEAFWGPIKEKMPFLEKTLPELYSPTREGPVTRELPALRQLAGPSVTTKNPFEKELDRLGFQYSEIFHSTGNPEADNLIKKHMGILSSQVMVPLVSSKDFQGIGDAQKGYIISEMLNGMRQAGKGAAEGEKPGLFLNIFMDHMPKRERAMLKEMGVNLKSLVQSSMEEGK